MAIVNYLTHFREKEPPVGVDLIITELPYDGDSFFEQVQYFHKGDAVKVTLPPDRTGATPEERILSTLFPKTKPYIIPLTGYYVEHMNDDFSTDWRPSGISSLDSGYIVLRPEDE